MSKRSEARLDLAEVIAALPAQKFDQQGRRGDDLFTAFHLAVEDPQRVRRESPLAILTEAAALSGQVRVDHLAEGRAAGRAAQGIDLELRIGYADAAQEVDEHQDDLGVHARVLRAEQLRVELVELAEPTFLGAFAAEHGTDGVELHHALRRVEAVLEVGPHDRGRRLGTHGQGFIPAVGEGVHLLSRRCPSSRRSSA